MLILKKIKKDVEFVYDNNTTKITLKVVNSSHIIVDILLLLFFILFYLTFVPKPLMWYMWILAQSVL